MTSRVALEELASIETGKRPKGGAHDSGIPSLGGEHVSTDGSLKLSPMRFIPEDFFRGLRKGRLAANDILIVKDGATTGRVGLVEQTFPYEDAAVNEHLFLVRADPAKIEARFLYYYLRSATGQSQIMSDFRGAAQGGISREIGRKVLVPNIPIDGQRRIVDLLSRAEGIVRLRREAQKKSAELIHALFLDMFGDPATNPKGWPSRPLSELVSFMSGGTPSKAREDFWEGDLPWVSPKDMKRIGIADAIDHVNRKVLTETNIKQVPVGSLLIVVRGMILIHTVPVALSLAPLTINQDMKALVPNLAINSTYLLWMMKVAHPQILNLVSTAAHGTKKLDTERLERFPIPLPSLEAQTMFANLVTQIESLQSQQSTATAKAQATFESLLAQSFQ